MVKTAIQLYTLRHIEESVPEIVTRVGESSFDGVEFWAAHLEAFEDESVIEETAAALDETGLEVAGWHLGADSIEEEFDRLVEICDAVGCETLVVPTYDSEQFQTREGVEGAADRLAGLAADLDEHGIDLLYHNHTFEFGEIEGGVAFEAFVETADGRFEFEPDVGLATHAGYDALDLLDLVGEQEPVVHLTDANPDDSDALHANVGTGVVDVDACAKKAAEYGAEWLVCENGVTEDSLEALEHGSVAFAELRDELDS